MQNKAIQAGLIMAAAAVGLFLIGIIIQPGPFANMALGIGTFVIAIVILAILAVRHRKSMDDVMNFSQAFIFMLIAWLVYTLVANGFNVLYANLIDPGYVDTLVNQSLEVTYGWLEGNVPDSQAKEILDDTEESIREQFTVMGALKSSGWSVVIGAVISAVMALFIRKEPEA